LVSAFFVGVCGLLLVFPEAETMAQATITVTTPLDEYDDGGTGSGCALREAIEAINTGGPFGGCPNDGTADVVEVPTGTYTLALLADGDHDTNSRGSLRIQRSMVILGAGADQTIISTTSAFDDRVLSLFGYDSARVILEKFTIQGGHLEDGSGGGVLVDMPCADGTSQVFLVDVVIRNNRAGGDGRKGGGLCSEGGGDITLNRVTVSENQAQFGGGIYFGNQYGTNSLRLTNVTISNNEAENSGGGLYASHNPAGAVVTATHVTFAGNRAIGGSGDNIYNRRSTVNLRSTIVAHGTNRSAADNCAGDPGANITSLGYNLDSGHGCALNRPSDLSGVDPMLDPLGDYGGGTLTHRLQASSPAVNHIPSTGGCDASVPFDQRLVFRPQPVGGHCDIGAFEVELPVLSIDKTVSPETGVARGGLVTYTVVLSNSGHVEGENVTLIDTLPGEVNFSAWVQQPPGADVANDELTWTGTVEAGGSRAFQFAARHAGLFGAVVSNTAQYSHASDTGSDTAKFTVEAGFTVCLPVVLKNLQP
jgi:uncharacterized repeat protein (TIGR01451 family)